MTEPVFFHGTRAGFSRGGYLTPASFHGKDPRAGHVGEHSTSYVYLTTDRDLAEWYALNSKGRGRPKILTVLPGGPIEHDLSPYDGESEDQYRCKEWSRVIAVEMLLDSKDVCSPSSGASETSPEIEGSS